MVEQTESFKKNYETLKSIATQLRQQQEPDIDALVPLVDEALKAYQVCKARIAVVSEAIGQRLPEELERL